MSRRALESRICRCIESVVSGVRADSFESLALAIHRWQARQGGVVAALVEGEIDHWRAIPAVPVRLFKELNVGNVQNPAVTFCTSGTTTGRRGIHRLRSATIYDYGAYVWFRRCVPQAPRTVLALLANPAEVNDSSLSYMVSLFGHVSWHVRGGRLDIDSLSQRLKVAQEPLFVATTAFALAEWLDSDPGPLPPKSVLMVTGGFKGRIHQIDHQLLYGRAQAALSPDEIVCEYGMTELTSQLWGSPEEPYRAPPWLRAVAVDPASGDPLPLEVPGQLRFFDLCNLDSSLAIETLDEGIVHQNGSVTLIGRLRGAPDRGCSLSIEEGWETE